jgi:hypothetical protein
VIGTWWYIVVEIKNEKKGNKKENVFFLKTRGLKYVHLFFCFFVTSQKKVGTKFISLFYGMGND